MPQAVTRKKQKRTTDSSASKCAPPPVDPSSSDNRTASSDVLPAGFALPFVASIAASSTDDKIDFAAYWWLLFMQKLREQIEQLHSDCKEALEPKQWRSLIRRAYFAQSKRPAKACRDYKTGTLEDKSDFVNAGEKEKQSEFSVWWKSSGAAEKTIVPLWVTTSTENSRIVRQRSHNHHPRRTVAKGSSRGANISISSHTISIMISAMHSWRK